MDKALIILKDGEESFNLDLTSINISADLSPNVLIDANPSEIYSYLFCPVSKLNDPKCKSLLSAIPNIVIYGGTDSGLSTIKMEGVFYETLSYLGNDTLNKQIIISFFIRHDGLKKLKEKVISNTYEKGQIIIEEEEDLEIALATISKLSANKFDTYERFEKIISTLENVVKACLKKQNEYIDANPNQHTKKNLLALKLDFSNVKFEVSIRDNIGIFNAKEFSEVLVNGDNQEAANNEIKQCYENASDVQLVHQDSGKSVLSLIFSYQQQYSKIILCNYSNELEKAEEEFKKKATEKEEKEEIFSKYFKKMAEGSHNGICIVRISTHDIEWYNSELRKMTFLKASEINNFKDVIPESCQSNFDSLVEMVVNLEAPADGEIDLLKGNGRTVYCKMFLTYLDKNYILVELKDVSNKVKLEKLTDEHAFFRSQQQELVETAKISALGTMIGGISHEINNPLAVMRGRIDIALQRIKAGKYDAEDMQYSLGRLKVMTIRMTDIIKHLRTFAFGFSQDVVRDIKLSDVISEAIFLLKNELSSKNINLEIEAQDAEVMIRAGMSSLVQVIFNIIHNSITAVEKSSERWVKIETNVDKEIVSIRIQDSGKGIAPEVSSKMMEPFFTTKEVGDGAGLGLSVAKRSLSQYGGKLKYLSEEENTTFEITLPCFIFDKNDDSFPISFNSVPNS